jgi:hypothetical protein
MSNFNYGHSNLFWELLIQAIEDESLEESRKRIVLISPWIRDIPLSTSNLTAEDFRNLLGVGSSFRMMTLTDVLFAMKQLNFEIDIVTLDSEDKRLPKNSRYWLKQESEFVKSLQQKEINVWKKIGLHAKMYIFPHGTLTGSTNLTPSGMFSNSENMTMKSIDERSDYDSYVINAGAILAGSQTYFSDRTVRPKRLEIPSEEIPAPREDKILEEIETSHPKEVDDQDHYLHSPGIALGDFKNTGSHYLEPHEVMHLNSHIQSFEQELRRIIIYFYRSEANVMKVWSAKKKRGEISNQPRSIWPRLLAVGIKTVNEDETEGISLYDKAEEQIFVKKTPPYEAEDFHDFKLPDRENLDAHTILTYGTTISDLRTCLIGDTSNLFHDFEKTNLLDQSLKCFTSNLTGIRGMADEDVRFFWKRLFDIDEAFSHIAFARNELFHSKPLARSRAMKCQTGLQLFEKRLMKRFSDFVER